MGRSGARSRARSLVAFPPPGLTSRQSRGCLKQEPSLPPLHFPCQHGRYMTTVPGCGFTTEKEEAVGEVTSPLRECFRVQSCRKMLERPDMRRKGRGPGEEGVRWEELSSLLLRPWLPRSLPTRSLPFPK